jgi:hypothetical protein
VRTPLALAPVLVALLLLGRTPASLATNAEPTTVFDEGDGNAGTADVVEYEGAIAATWHVHETNPDAERIEYSTSGDNGHTFSDPVVIESPYTFNSFPNIAAVNDSLFIFFEGRNDVNSSGDIVYTKSADDGEHWTTPEIIGSTARFAKVQVVTSGNYINVAWCCSGGDSHAQLVQSDDGGESFFGPNDLGPGTETPQLAIEDAMHTWTVVQTQKASPNFENVRIYRWQNGDNPQMVHAIQTYPYHSWITMGNPPAGGGAPPLWVYFQTLLTPSTVEIARLDAADGDSWHDPVDTGISYTVGDPKLAVGDDYLVFSYTPTSQTQEFSVYNTISEDAGDTWSQPKEVSPADVNSIFPSVYTDGDRIINAYTTTTGPIAGSVGIAGIAGGGGISASNDKNDTVSRILLEDAEESFLFQLFPLRQPSNEAQTAGAPETELLPPFLLHWLQPDTSLFDVAFAPGAVTGDATCDNAVTGADLLSTLGEASGLDEAPCKAGADTNCNNGVDVDDALRIVAFLASLPKDPPANCMRVDV